MKVLILAAGRSSRFDGKKSKLLQVFSEGRTVIEQTIKTLEDAGFPPPFNLVVGHQGDEMKRLLGHNFEYVYQRHLRGTGTAAQCYITSQRVRDKELLVVLGDLPLLQPETLLDFYRAAKDFNFGLMTVDVPHRDEFRWIQFNDLGQIVGVDKNKKTGVGDVGVYWFKTKWLKSRIFKLKPDITGEVHLDSIIEVAVQEKTPILEFRLKNVHESYGVNTIEDLKIARRQYENLRSSSDSSS